MKNKTSPKLLKSLLFVFFSFLPLILIAQNITVTGTVTDLQNEPLIGVTIQVQGTAHGTITDSNGRFSLTNVPANAKLEISYVGMQSQIIDVDNRTTINVVLRDDTELLEEVVVIGYGIQKKESITGAISSVKSEDIIKSPTGSLSTALTGKLTGLTTIQSSGQPGQEFPRLRIRGSDNPIVIVDGIERSSGGLIPSSDGTNGAISGWESINPNDIESVSILKDASATAVYGVRGANGVIIITTKRGMDGKPIIHYSGNLGISTPIRLRHNIGSYEYGLFANEGYYNDGLAPFMPYETLNRYRYHYNDLLYPSMDYADYLMNDYSTKQNHNLSIRGGDQLVKYFVSTNFYDEDGLMKNFEAYGFDANQHYKRLSLRSNLDFQFTERFSGSLNIDGRFEKRNGANAPRDSHFFWKLYQPHPWISPGFDEEGRYIVSNIEKEVPVFQYILSGGIYNHNQITGNAILSLKHALDFITPGLSVQAKYSFDSYINTMYSRTRSYATYQPIEVDKQIYLRKTGEDGWLNYNPAGSSKVKKQYFDFSFNYEKQFDDHFVTGLALYNQEKTHYQESSFPDVPHAYLGFVGRITYNYKNRYFSEFNIGINGSENFPRKTRFGVFPALSLAWLLSDEPFMNITEKYLTFCKLRMSYGEVGNDRDIRRFLYLPTTFSRYPAGYQFFFGEPTTNYGSISPIQEGVAPNYNVTWERTRKFNVGMDIRLMDKLSVGVDLFNEKRSDILTTMQTIPSFQFLQTYSNSMFVTPNLLSPQNYAKTQTDGFELELGLYGKIGRNFRYMFKGTYAFAKRKWVLVSETYQPYPWMYSEGYDVGEIRGLVADGFWDSYDEINNPQNPYVTFNPNPIPGDIKYKDINGDMKIDRYDVIPKGKTSTPRSTITFTTELNWRNFDFSILFQGATDVIYVPNEENRVMMNEGWGSYTWIRDRWTPQTRDGYYPALHSVNNVSQSNFQSSTFWEYDATYLRLKNLELGYTIPTGVIKKVGINDMRVYITGQNLFTWTPFSKMMNRYDPESSTGRLIYHPVMCVYNIGISLTF